MHPLVEIHNIWVSAYQPCFTVRSPSQNKKNWRAFRRSAGKGVCGAMPCVNLSGLCKHPHSKGAFDLLFSLQPENLKTLTSIIRTSSYWVETWILNPDLIQVLNWSWQCQDPKELLLNTLPWKLRAPQIIKVFSESRSKFWCCEFGCLQFFGTRLYRY